MPSPSPVTVTVCTGPTCSMSDTPTILRMLKRLPAARDGRLEVSTRQCFARCEVPAAKLCPCVRLGTTFIVQATVEDVRLQVETALQAAASEAIADMGNGPPAAPPTVDPFARYLK